MSTKPAARLRYLVGIIPAKLFAISIYDLNLKPAPEIWSKKEVIGHLIDSAANNHQRFIRVQYEDAPTIIYDQNKWNKLNGYADCDAAELIQLWAAYNLHLANIMDRTKEPELQRLCNTGGVIPVTLQWLIEDYVAHLEHHLRDIVDY